MLKTLTAITFTFVASFALAEQLPYQDPNLSSEVRANDLISRLTLAGKTQLMCDESKAIPHLGIKTFNWWSEALHGMAYGTNVTVLPEPIGMAASFDEELVHDAILQAWYGGQASGQAVADVLFGDYNPSGKLPISFYRDSSKLGDFEDYSMKGRTYRFTDDVLFPFGYGLSYTNFTFGKASLSKATIKTDETILLTVPVSNTGQRDGTEVIQVYVRKVDDTNGPLKTLRGFTRIELAAGQTQQAMVALSPAAFEFYDRSLRTMAVTPGQYEILYGNSSAANALQSTSLTILQ